MSNNFDVISFQGIEYDIRYCIDPEREYEDQITVSTEFGSKIVYRRTI